MALLKLKIPPAGDGYSVELGEQAASVALEGGPSRSRQDVIGAPNRVTARWVLDRAGYEYMMAFDALTAAKGLPFLIDLVMEGAALGEREAKFVKRPKLSSQRGLSVFYVEAALEVVAVPIDDETATTIVEAYVPGVTKALGDGGVLDGVLA